MQRRPRRTIVFFCDVATCIDSMIDILANEKKHTRSCTCRLRMRPYLLYIRTLLVHCNRIQCREPSHFCCAFYVFFQQRTNDRCKTKRHKPSSFFLEGGHVLIVAISCSMMILFKKDLMFCVFSPKQKVQKTWKIINKKQETFF